MSAVKKALDAVFDWFVGFIPAEAGMKPRILLIAGDLQQLPPKYRGKHHSIF
jgi:hypothetical protein